MTTANLTMLSSFQQRLADKNKEREQAGEKYLARGMQQLKLALTKDAIDMNLLKETMHQFLATVRQDAKNEMAYLGLALIFYLLDEGDKALLMLEEANYLNPQEALIAELKEMVIQAGREKRAVELVRMISDDPSEIHDLLGFSRLIEAAIIELIETYASRSLQPSTKPQVVKETLQTARELEKHIDFFQQQIAFISSEINTTGLSQHLHALHTLHSRAWQALNATSQFAKIDQALQGSFNLTRQLLLEANGVTEDSEVLDLENQMDPLFDQCDQLADKLDDLEEQHLPVGDFIARYEQLISCVNALQDKLEDLP